MGLANLYHFPLDQQIYVFHDNIQSFHKTLLNIPYSFH